MRLKLEQWLILFFFGFNILLVAAISIAFYAQIKQSMLDRTLQQLQSINILKYNMLHQFLQNREKELQYIITAKDTSPSVVNRLMAIEDLQVLLIVKEDSTYRFSRSSKPQIVNVADTFPIGVTAYNANMQDYGFMFVHKNDFTIVAFFSIDKMEQILLERTGMGTSGESYLVNRNNTMQTKSRFFPELDPIKIDVETNGVKEAFKSIAGLGVYLDYRDVPIVGAYQLFEYDQIDWALLTEIDFAEAMQPVLVIRDRFILISGFIILLSLLVSILLARKLSQPIRHLFDKLNLLSRGILPENNVEYKMHISEIKQITDAINQLIISMRQTSSFAQAIGKGNFEVDHQLLSSEDELGKSIVTMRDQLIILNEQKATLEKETKKLLVETEEKERERISMDLHDGIGPLLTAIKMKVSAEKSIPPRETLKLIDDTIQEVRRISRNLMPSLIRDFGPGAALQQLVDDINKSQSNVVIQFSIEELAEASNINKQTAISVYRIGQESLNNALKHADATRINMSITEFEDNLSFYISDNGKGFEVNSLNQTHGKGLKNIKERVNMLNGSFVIESNNQGTMLEVIIPLL